MLSFGRRGRLKPAKRGEPVEQVEAQSDDVHRHEHQNPQGRLERLQERHQLGGAGLLKRKLNTRYILSSKETTTVASKKLPNVYKNCPKMIFTREMKDSDAFIKIALKSLQFLPNNFCHRL